MPEEETPPNRSDDVFAALTPDGWKPLQAEFYKPLLRYQGQEYQLERIVTGEEGFMQMDLITVQAAKNQEHAKNQANKK